MDPSNDPRLIELLDRVATATLPLPSREQAFQAFYDLTCSKMYGLALRVVGNRDWAEDVLQEAYLQVWRTAGTYRSSLSPPLAWVGIVVRSRALDFLRRRNSERADAALELDDAMAETLPGDAANPMDTRQASEAAWALHECLRKLEGKQREVVSLAYLRDLSHGELAEQLRLPLGTVKTWIRRGLEQLRGCMSRFA
ncbi:sigma-70 family RNA polymerase sigma factor [Ramlibacter sp. USB13]|uniref:Sigma-70 family RNA polymerase sigma factor n=1 Tax=Ramlibacter cellulosilyticus TaxID=2764187 RepID=A0A923SGM5_9BURK|nr:sigma-70 family RNA polymerase sigma factor [Ramlibacter cellulosilyticus]MBC5785067.1 sigma-70 family RNA polymerase sigma factor [Ramlibacter cellulosilyticus]